jgi:hypothetical protein
MKGSVDAADDCIIHHGVRSINHEVMRVPSGWRGGADTRRLSIVLWSLVWDHLALQMPRGCGRRAFRPDSHYSYRARSLTGIRDDRFRCLPCSSERPSRAVTRRFSQVLSSFFGNPHSASKPTETQPTCNVPRDEEHHTPAGKMRGEQVTTTTPAVE